MVQKYIHAEVIQNDISFINEWQRNELFSNRVWRLILNELTGTRVGVTYMWVTAVGEQQSYFDF